MTNLFRLFRAPLSEASDVCEDIDCSICGAHADLGFVLDIGADVIVACSACGHTAALNAEERDVVSCQRCRAPISFPIDADEEIVACPTCLIGRRVAVTKDTELGMVRWGDAQRGRTQGLPGFKSNEWPTSPPDERGWVAVHVSRDHLVELVSTPTYSTIQGDKWLFCCHEPMAFVGQWSRQRFSEEAADGDGSALFSSIVERVVPGLWEDELHDVTGVYVFECCRCKRKRAHWDIA